LGGLDFAHLIFAHVVVANPDGESADTSVLIPHIGKKPICHAEQGGLDIFFIDSIRRKRFLFAE
jgi:hypothetical protein